MMPESFHQNDHFVQALKDNDVTGIINSISNDVFDINFRDVTHDLETPLMRLCHSGVSDEDMDSVLGAAEGKNPDVNLQDAVGRTLAMHACIALRHQIVVFSLDQGYDASMCDRVGRSAYHYAAESGSDWIMASLLKQPDALTCLKVLDYKGYSPTDLARHRKAHTVVKMISQMMSRNDNDSNPRPLNPKPLQPAFMRTTNFNQNQNKKQVSFSADAETNNRPNPSLGPISNPKHASMTRKENDNHEIQSDRWEEMPERDSNSLKNNNNVTKSNTGNGQNDNYEEMNNSVDNDDWDDNFQQTNLSPLRNTSCKQNTDKLEGFSSSPPMGLIKPRPLPRLLANQIKDTPPRDANPEYAINDYVTVTKNDDIQAMDTNITPEPIQNDTPRKPSAKQNNIFTLRPAQSNSPSNRTRLLAQEQNRNDSLLPNPEPKSSSEKLSKSNSNSPQVSRRNKISLDLSLGTGTTNNTDSKTPSPRQLGPVVSPRKVPHTIGHRAVDDLINTSMNKYNELKAKFNPAKLDGTNAPSNLDQPDSDVSADPNEEAREDDATSRTNNIAHRHADKSTRDNDRFSKMKGRQQHCHIPEAGRRDLEAILSPVPTHRPLLQKRKPTDSIKAKCDTLQDSYSVETKHAGTNDKDGMFEEEIFLNCDNGSLKLGSIKTREEVKANRPGSRLTIRRSSLSLPDLRDMTRCLVMSQDKSGRTGIKHLETFDTGNRDNKKDKGGDNDNKNSDDENDYDVDKAEMDGDKSDDEVECDLDDDAKTKIISGTKINKGRTVSARGGNSEIPLPSIQITSESEFISSQESGFGSPMELMSTVSK